MATMGKYCKAYLAKQFRQFEQWSEDIAAIQVSTSAMPEKTAINNTALNDDDVLYLQENYVVTYGIFQDEQIVFDQITPEWQQFCQTVLQFEVPAFEVPALEASTQTAQS